MRGPLAVGVKREGSGARELTAASSTSSSTASALAHELPRTPHPQHDLAMSSPLRLPLEVIECILFFALGGDEPLATPLTSDDPLSPPVGTSHLLLISRGITALALPLYWRSVTILRADDWVKLWDPETGLFAGKAGQARASWVKEVRLNVRRRAAFPIEPTHISSEPFLKNGDGYVMANDLLVDRVSVPFPRLKHVCFFSSSVGSASDVQPGRIGPGDKEWRTECKGY